jgi:predicted  nucleic acid-binding Zn-ribbon protein
MTTKTRQATELQHRLDEVERRLEAIARHVAEMEDLKKQVGNLKLELEEMREE